MNPNLDNFAVRYELVKKIDRDKLVDPEMDFRKPKVCASFLRNLQYFALEKHVCLFLDRAGRCLGTVEYTGTETSVQISVSETVACAILSGAELVVFVHNHPTHLIDGELTFSKQDLLVIDKFTWLFGVVGLKFHDSIIISADRYTSHQMQLAEKKRKEEMSAYERGDLYLVSEKLPETTNRFENKMKSFEEEDNANKSE